MQKLTNLDETTRILTIKKQTDHAVSLFLIISLGQSNRSCRADLQNRECIG